MLTIFAGFPDCLEVLVHLADDLISGAEYKSVGPLAILIPVGRMNANAMMF
jgi:hypothetical protein